MAKYRKKPVVIDAEVYKEGMEDGFKLAQIAANVRGVTSKPYISTLEGDMIIDDGDYIITGIEGERYPCKPGIFHKTYDLIEEPTVNALEANETCEILRDKISQIKYLMSMIQEDKDKYPIKIATLFDVEQYFFKQLIDTEQKLASLHIEL